MKKKKKEDEGSDNEVLHLNALTLDTDETSSEMSQDETTSEEYEERKPMLTLTLPRMPTVPDLGIKRAIAKATSPSRRDAKAQTKPRRRRAKFKRS